MLYYPGFEAQNANWLKFALLYLDELRPIIPAIPYSREIYLSSHTIRIMDETNLIRPYCPEYDEGRWASQKAIENLDAFLRNPQIYGGRFGYSYHHSFNTEISAYWKNVNQHTYTLYHGKYSDDFYNYCLSERIGSTCNEGIKVPKRLAYLYMSFLAEIISVSQEIESITDSFGYNELLLNRNIKIARTTDLELKYAQSNIDVNLPKDISQIPLNVFISLRSSDEFNQLRRAYVQEIKQLIIAKENNDLGYSLDKLLDYKKDFIKICESCFNMLASTTLTSFGINELLNGNLDAFSFLSTSAGIYGDSRAIPNFIKELPSSINNIHKKHLTRKYLAQLKRIS